jgi:putative endopeptidase
MVRWFALVCMVVLVCSVAASGEPRSGIDPAGMDPTVSPREDFWTFANGKWLAATPIPADRSAWDSFSELRETTQGQLRRVIEDIDPHELSEGRRKVADFYASFMDEAGIESLGLARLRETMASIHGVRDKAELPVLFADLERLLSHRRCAYARGPRRLSRAYRDNVVARRRDRDGAKRGRDHRT